jgi:SAM-dependent methyltransferase
MMDHEVANLLPMGMGIDQHAILYRAEDRIIRAIKPRATEFYREVLTHPTVVGLMKDGILIETRESDIKIKGHDLVLEHPLLPVVSYPFEWTPNMYRDAAMNVLRLNAELLKAGLCTHDAHLWNVLFDGITPRFIDFTSIIKALPGNKWRAKAQFTNYCLNPLLVMDAGFPTTARSLLREILAYPDPVMVRTLLHGPVRTAQLSDQARSVVHRFSKYLATRLAPETKNAIKKVWGATQRVSSVLRNEDEIADVAALLEKVESLRLVPPTAQWSEYYSGNNELPIYDGSQAVLDRIRDSTPKHGLVSDILRKLNPKSVLDLGCNRGLYSQIAALQGSRVVGVDLDERALDDMYLDSKRMKTDALPLYINAVAPVEATGFQEIPFPTVAKRLRAELVMGLALVHHLVFKTTRMSFAHIAKLFDSYAEKCILVEFVPKEDVHIRSWYTDEFDWYTLDNFKLALSEYFPVLEVFESFPSPRVILYGVKK